MKKYWPILMLITLASPLWAQKQDHHAWNAGLELDALPYLTGGYFAAGWAGKDLWRIRALTADVHKPDWSTPAGFSRHHITAYALVVDRFLKPDWQGWWIGGGLVYWESTIQTTARLQTARLSNLLLNGSLGYHIRLGRHFYLSPWAGLSLRVSGDKNVPVDGRFFTLPLLNPEASAKVGVWF
jgi:GNAT superfamily N-acetyltransferase